jgi:hypothetical protein
VTSEIAARLAECDIQLAAQAKDYCMFVRGNCMALVQIAGDRFTSMGSCGLMTERGLAYLVWNSGKAILSSHGAQVAADAEQVEAIGKFSEDLKSIILPPSSADERR